MKTKKDVKQIVKKWRVAPRMEMHERTLTAVLKAHAETQKTKMASEQPNIGRKIMKSSITKLAAAVVLIGALGSYLFFGDSQATLYAQVMEVLEDTQTIHFVGENLIDGQLTKGEEVWYDRDKGIVRTFWHEGQKNSVLIDDGKHMWYYSKFNDVATRAKSRRDSIDIIEKLLELHNFKSGVERDPDNDKIIDGIMCKAYVLSSTPKTRIARFWVDENKRIRIYEKAQLGDDGQWHKISICRAEYNIPIEPNIFVADFGSSVKKIHADKLIEENFDLNKAVFSKETDGLIFAVHELSKCENNITYIVCSVRPTEEVKREARYIGFTTARMYGYFDWLPLSKAEQYCPIRLLEMYHDGVLVKWNLMVPRTSLSEKADEFEVGVRIWYEGRLANKRRRENMPTKVTFDSICTLPFEKQQLLLEKVIADTYSEYERFQPLKALDLLQLNLSSFRKSPVTDVEDYTEQIMHRINTVRGDN
ncbi:MAG: hypothetical protein GY774_29960 [Planctomycetes bacterium]|nr:hypothetical protein [Planctomycetota bacterium]